MSSLSGTLASGFQTFVSMTPGVVSKPRGSRGSQGSSGYIARHLSDDAGCDGIDSSSNSLTSKSLGQQEKEPSPLAKAIRNVGAMWTGGEGGSGKTAKRTGAKMIRR